MIIKNEEVLNEIDRIISKCKSTMPKTELGYFATPQERAFRREVVDEVFCSLNKENQDVVLNCLLRTMKAQYK